MAWGIACDMDRPVKSSPVPAPAPRQFSQARAHGTYEALLAAAQGVFAEKGFEAAQTPDIAARAGVATGTFYRYFTDKRQAFVEMIARHLTAAHDRVMTRLTPAAFSAHDPRAVVDEVIDVLFAEVGRLPALQGVYLAMSLRDPDVARLRATFEARACDELSQLIDLLVPRKRVPDPRAAAFVIQRAALDLALAQSDPLLPRVDDQAVRTALGDMLHRYLFAESPPASRPRPASSRRAKGKPRRRSPKRLSDGA